MVKEFSCLQSPYHFSHTKSDKEKAGFTQHHFSKNGAGFTTLELLVSISIFIFMTTLLFIETKQFDRGVILTNVARDVVMHIRTAQNYSLNVKQSGGSFDVGYGVHFSTLSGENTEATLFAFLKNNEALYSQAISGSEVAYTIKNAIYIEEICAGSTKADCLSKGSIDVSFKRPNPDAVICAGSPCPPSPYAYARVTLSTPDGDRRYVIVTKTGLISVEDSL